MVFGLAAPWAAGVSIGSASKNNLMTVISGTGADLAGLDKSLHKIVVCTLDGSGLLKDHVYCANAAADAWIDISSIASHTHSSTAQGGTLMDIFTANPLFYDSGSYFMHNV